MAWSREQVESSEWNGGFVAYPTGRSRVFASFLKVKEEAGSRQDLRMAISEMALFCTVMSTVDAARYDLSRISEWAGYEMGITESR